jgi:predicted pyridoxine 5'-phosphate oxidase superfamily flavin-nucleotide-binding protein
VNAYADDSPFHAGELEIQTRAGVRERIDAGARRFIRPAMPDQHREFFAQLPFIVAGMLDHDGDPWATLLTGAPGFLSTPDDRHLQVNAALPAGHPLEREIAPGANLGLLGIEFHTQRRNRANGRVDSVGERGFRVAVNQSFGNCPKYITRHQLVLSDAAAPTQFESGEGPRLSERARATIRAASTLFIATAAKPDAADHREGCDVSHRGGEPGFVVVDDADGQTRLTIPDYRGNNLFNTYGNILQYPRAGLVFPDFENGRALMLSGDARILWLPDRRELQIFPQRGGWQPLALRNSPGTAPYPSNTSP